MSRLSMTMRPRCDLSSRHDGGIDVAGVGGLSYTVEASHTLMTDESDQTDTTKGVV
jgi:hypothetical protein